MEKSFKLAGEVVQSFLSVNRALMGFTQRNAASLGLTVPQMGILNAIYAKMGSTLKEITERLHLPKSTASIGVDDLVNLGLVERKASEEDRREVSLSVTAKGEELAMKSVSNSSSYRAMESALCELDEGETETLLRLHRKLEKHLLEH